MKFQSKAPNYRIQRNSLVGWCIHFTCRIDSRHCQIPKPSIPSAPLGMARNKEQTNKKADKTSKCYFGGSLTKKSMKGKQGLEKPSNKGGAETPRIKQ